MHVYSTYICVYAVRHSNSKCVIPLWICVLFKEGQSKTWWTAQWSIFLSFSLEYFPHGNQHHWDLVQIQAIQIRCAWFHSEFVFFREERSWKIKVFVNSEASSTCMKYLAKVVGEHLWFENLLAEWANININLHYTYKKLNMKLLG